MNNTGLLVKLVEEDYGLKWNGGKWARAIEHDSLIINTEEDFFFWNSENKYGDSKDYLVQVRHLDPKAAEEYVRSVNGGVSKISGDTPSIPYDKLIEILWLEGKTNREYWYKRTLKDSTIDRFRLGYFEGWNLIPLYQDGHFINFQCRRDEPEKRIKSWYRGQPTVVFNADIMKFTNRIFITEGPVDAIALAQNGVPAVSHNGGASGFKSEWIKYFMRQKEIYYIADNDKAGIEGARKTVSILGSERTKVFRFKDKEEKFDSVDFFREGGTGKDFLEIVTKGAVMGYCEGDF